MGTVEKWASFLTENSYNDIPVDAIEKALVHLIDTVGVTLAGTADPIGKTVTKYVRMHKGPPEAGVFGAGFKTSVTEAVFANGVMSHCLDYDDSYVSRGHPSTATVPTVLALGENLHISGKAALEAYVLALEIMGRIAINLGKPFQFFHRGWHTTAIWGTMGACAAAAKILKLDVNQTRMAFGIAASAAGGLAKNMGTFTKSFHAGNANRNGVLAALLAKEGWTADPEIMEGDKGFAHAMAGEGNYDLEKMVENLGKPFSTTALYPGLCIKKYPCGFTLHWALDETLFLVKEHKISYRDVENIEVGVAPPASGFAHKEEGAPDIKSGLRGKFSLHYPVAAAVVDGQISMHTFDDDKVQRPEIKEIMGRITTKEFPLPANYPLTRNTPVTITLKDGRKFTHHVDKPYGYPDIPVTREQLLFKYRDCAASVLPAEKIEESIRLLEKLPELKDISPLVRIFTRNYKQE